MTPSITLNRFASSSRKLVEAGTPKKLALVASMRKLPVMSDRW